MNGNLVVSEGTAPYAWQEWVLASSTPITNQTECTDCGYVWNNLLSKCMNGTQTVTSCYSQAHWSTFSTGTSITPPFQFPIRVIDVNEIFVVIDSLDSMPYCLPTSINKLSTFTFNLYPNPTNGNVTIEMNNNLNEQLTLKVFNIIGDEVFISLLKNEKKQSFDLRGLANGLYFVKISGNKFNKIEKLIIQKMY